MSIKIEDTKLEGVKYISLDVFNDHRGNYTEVYNAELYSNFGVKWVQDDVSVSKIHVIRGIHGDEETYKLVSCPYGFIYLAVVDCREGRNFGKWESFFLDMNNQVFVPPGRGVGHLVLTNIAVFSYKQSTYYDREKQFTYRYDDPRFNIRWPVQEPILSSRDKKGDK